MSSLLINEDIYCKINDRGGGNNMKDIKTFNLDSLNITFATREIARFAVNETLAKKCQAISFKNIKSTSRSFLDELFVVSQKNNISLVDIPAEIESLYAIIKKTHRNQKMYAPMIKVRVSNTVFA